MRPVKSWLELRPDLVFMDIQMPGGNGIEIAGAA
jgi:CheY-like chemotaxis protein